MRRFTSIRSRRPSARRSKRSSSRSAPPTPTSRPRRGQLLEGGGGGRGRGERGRGGAHARRSRPSRGAIEADEPGDRAGAREAARDPNPRAAGGAGARGSRPRPTRARWVARRKRAGRGRAAGRPRAGSRNGSGNADGHVGARCNLRPTPQRQRIRAEPAGAAGPAVDASVQSGRRRRETRQQVLEAFKGDQFVMSQVAPPRDPRLVEAGAERIVRMAKASAPVLTPEISERRRPLRCGQWPRARRRSNGAVGSENERGRLRDGVGLVPFVCATGEETATGAPANVARCSPTGASATSTSFKLPPPRTAALRATFRGSSYGVAVHVHEARDRLLSESMRPVDVARRAVGQGGLKVVEVAKAPDRRAPRDVRGPASFFAPLPTSHASEIHATVSPPCTSRLLEIRAGTADDVPTVSAFVRELAAYERTARRRRGDGGGLSSPRIRRAAILQDAHRRVGRKRLRALCFTSSASRPGREGQESPHRYYHFAR